MSKSITILNEKEFVHILRILNTNVSGKQKVAYALKSIKGIGRRFSHLILRKAGVDCNKRAGELKEDEINKLTDIISRPTDFNIPKWFLNRQKDVREGNYTQLVSNNLDTKLREDLERMKKIRLHRGLRHYWGVKVRGQHTNSTGRTGNAMGVQRKK